MPVYNGRKLDWVPRHDPLSLNFLVSDAIPEQEERWRYWRPGANLDQGPDGACVGFGWTADLIGSPMPDFKVTPEIANPYAFDLYHESQRNDQWAGEDYEGTSVLAGAKVVKSRGFISEYRWARGIEDLAQLLSNGGEACVPMGRTKVRLPFVA
jgi:hypothetical protein